ncbi:MAG: NADP-dependent malic enzyme [Acidobacteria bacterium]|nr:MAG: NADP-dependent malic enzyme [Acidobacteriota bacterium]
MAGRYREQALEYHAREPAGKIEVVPTKPTGTAKDLSLAYSPGVAEPCLEIADDPQRAYEYTAKGNLVAVISNGTAVLGLGDIGPAAAKPVMEGKGVLFKKFAGIDVFDLEVAAADPEEFIRVVRALEPTFGGINLEDIKAPECFEIERRLQQELSIPVFHDDQHGTAIIGGAALINAAEVVGKRLEDLRIVFLGAGAAALASAELWSHLGVPRQHMTLCDSTGVIHRGRREGMNPYKEMYAVDTEARTLSEALRGADVFVGLSVANQLSPEMLKTMAERPIVFALANPDPEIEYDLAKSTRADVVMATGRSDTPNQVNNVLGFPFLFRGALDVRARTINTEMKLAACRALADLAREDVPDAVLKAYGLDELRFGPEYLIPKPFDSRVLFRVPIAVARAAIDSGVARCELGDEDAYVARLEKLVSRRFELMRVVIDRAKKSPQRIVFPEGEHEKILRAAKILVEEGIARPILLARPEKVEERMASLELSRQDVELVQILEDTRRSAYAERLHQLRRRQGVTREDATKLLRSRNYFATMMVEQGDADGLISGLTQDYPETIRPALQVLHARRDVQRVAGAYILLLEERVLFLADTTVNIDPSAEQLADIALLTAEFARRFQIEPRVAMLSFSNFGSNQHPSARKVQRATAIVQSQRPELEIDGEMQADTAVLQSILDERYPWSRLRRPANVLVFPELQSANIAYKLLWRLADAEAIGPVLLGVDRPVHVLQRGVEVADIVNMAAICAVDALERTDGAQRLL